MIEEIIISDFHKSSARPIYRSYVNTPNFTKCGIIKPKATKKEKAVVILSSAIGMAPVLAFWASKKGFSLKPSKIFKSPIKDWAIFKYKPIDKVINFKEPEIISTAIGSIIGGYIGGSIVDNKNERAKRREVLNQVLGNVFAPVGFVSAWARLFDKHKTRFETLIPQIKSEKTIAKGINAVSKNLPYGVGTLVSLVAGVFIGNRISNFINEKIYKKDVDRNVKITDFACHVDDICMAISMTNGSSTLGSALARFIPVALLIPGVETGTAKEDSKS